MTKKLKHMIRRVIIGAVLFLCGVVAESLLPILVPSLFLYAAAYFVIGWNVLKNAGINIVHGHIFDENFLMIIATVGAIICHEYREAVAVMLFFQVGECFQTYAVNKSRKSIKALMEIRPDFARVVRDGKEEEIDPSEVSVGETILIKPGERIPLDGVVLEGVSALDTAAITGESIPKDVAVGDVVVSGCVNTYGVLTVEVNAIFGESTVSKVLSLVEDASSKKAKAEQFITVFSRTYTPLIVGLAVILGVGGTIVSGDFLTWFYRAATFLLISCPCALVISIPLSFFGGIGGASRAGILIKGGNYIDALSKIDILVCDKTGTITKGNFALADAEITDYFSGLYEDAEERLVEFAALSESYTTHPIGLSIIEKYGKETDKTRVRNVSEIAGKGVEATVDGIVCRVGNRALMEEVLDRNDIEVLSKCSHEGIAGTVVYVAVDGRFAGHLHIIDEIKDDSKTAVAALKNSGIRRIVMLTGDNAASAEGVSKEVGIDEYYANLTPLEKVETLERIMAENRGSKVAFAGDGINDAPVLSRADIGIAMGALGSDAAIEAADVVIMTDELSRISLAKSIARRTIRIVKENIVLALSVKAAVLILAAFGIAHMGAAIFADVGVAFLAIMNAMRALRA